MAPNIPPEVTLMILGYIIHGPKQRLQAERSVDMSSMVMGTAHEAPMYATVSRTWQEVIERETFRELRLDLDRLRHWGSIMIPRRRGYVRLLHLDVVLPRYSDAAWAQVETEEEQQQNNLIATATIKEFIEQLSTWKKEDLPAGHILELWMHAYSPSDEGRWTREEWKDRRAWPGTKWPQIYEKRYENSVLELTDLDMTILPEVFAVTSLKNIQRSGRHVAPGFVCALIGRLRNVRKAAFVAWDDPTESSERRHRIRTAYALAVQDVTVLPEDLSLSQILKRGALEDHSAQPVVFTPPGTDDQLSINLRGLSQRASRLALGGVIIGDEFFWPSRLGSSIDNDETPHWPHLWSLQMGVALSTPDGRWRFDFAQPESQSESNADSGSEQGNRLRIQANPDLVNTLYRSAARAAMEMPKLTFMRLSFSGWGARGVNFHTFIYQIKESKVTATWYCYPPFQPREDVAEDWKEVGVKYHSTRTEIAFSDKRPSR